jgi:hypothetical protein
MFEAALSILRRAYTNFSGVQVLNAYLLLLLVGTIYIYMLYSIYLCSIPRL